MDRELSLMAWQSPSVMAGSGGLSGQPGEGVTGSHPQGTEYTLQGQFALALGRSNA